MNSNEPPAFSSPNISDSFARLWFSTGSCLNLEWHGIHIQKNPLDLFLYADIIFRQKPELIIEVGAAAGGSTLFFAHMLDLIGRGSIISIDSSPQWHSRVAAHPRISTWVGNSLDWKEPLGGLSPRNIFIILDSNHSESHVAAELAHFSPLIPIGGHLIVEDTIINHPAPSGASSPWEAVDAFLASHPNWILSPYAGRLLFSFANHGYLQRIS